MDSAPYGKKPFFVALSDWFDDLVERFINYGALPSDSEEEKLRKSTLLMGTLAITFLPAFWVLVYYSVGLRRVAIVPLMHMVFSALLLSTGMKLKNFRLLRFSGLLIMLVFPFLLQFVLGGFVASSGIAVWAIMAPIGAVMFYSFKESLPWLVWYITFTLAFGFIENLGIIHPQKVPSEISIAMFVMNFSIFAITLSFLLLYYILRIERTKLFLNREHRLLRKEQDKSEALLLNILPKSIAEQLKRNEDTIVAQKFDNVTVLFADMEGFTSLSTKLTAEELITTLNQIFSIFDSLAEKHGIEKIKTIGDAYMAVAGAPLYREDHCEAIIEMALDMRRELTRFNIVHNTSFNIRIGINSGPVIAGVIGTKKFTYDLWGDTVNMASRMESHGKVNEIQVTENVYDSMSGKYRFFKRRKIKIKGKGMTQTYFLTDRVPNTY